MLSPNLMPIVIAGLAFLIFAIMRPGKISAGVVPLAFARAPMLRAGLIGALVSGVVGMLVNDSGTAVLSMVVALAVPLVLYAGINSAPEEAQVAGPLGDDAVDGAGDDGAGDGAASGAANESDGHAGVVAGKA